MMFTCPNETCRFMMKAPQYLVGTGEEAIPLPSRLLCPKCFGAVPFKWDELSKHYFTSRNP